MTRALPALGLGLAIALPRPAAGQSVTARLGGELTAFYGGTVIVPVAVDMTASGGEKLGSYTARLTWDPTKLASCLPYCTATEGNFPAAQFNTDSVGFGVVKFTAISPAGAGGLVTVAQLPFTIADTTSAARPLTLSFSEMTAAGTFTNLLPSLTTLSGAICPARGRWGDLDADGKANSRDALLTLSQVVGLPVDTTYDTGLADVNADGKVQSVDALIILSYAVGIDVPGQRVLLLAPSNCGTGSARTLSISPSSAQLVPNQTLPLLLQATDSAGRLVSVSDAVWRSSDYNVATVDGAGVVTPRAAGTVTITGEVGPGVQATATLTVIPRRAVWEVDARATGAAVQLGTAGFPYEHPARAFAFVGEGDTIHVAPGNYDFTESGILGVGVVIRGGTAGDTTTRPLFRDAFRGSDAALELEGGQRTVVQNVAFRNFAEAVDLEGVRTFALEDSRVESQSGTYGSGIYSCTGTTIDTLRVDRSVFVGDSGGAALDNDYCVPRTALVLVRDSKISGWYDGILWPDADSLAVLRSTITDNDGSGIYTTQEYAETPSLYVAHSRIERNASEEIYGSYLRRAVIDTSVITTVNDDAIAVSGGCSECGGTTIRLAALHGDTINMAADDYTWISATDADTLAIDGAVVRFNDTLAIYANGYASTVSLARITNSQFQFVGTGTLLNFYGDSLFVNNVQVSGCSAANCDQAYGFYGTATNATFRNSSFSRVYFSVEISGNGGVHEASSLVMDSVAYGAELGGDSALVQHNRLTRVLYQGIEAGTGTASLPRGVVFSGNSISCNPVAGSQYGLLLDTQRKITALGDTVSGCWSNLYVSGVLSGSSIRGNALRGGAYGINDAQYFLDTVSVQVDSNGISGASAAAAYYAGGGQVVFTRNRVESNAQYGVQINEATPYLHVVTGNAFAANPGGAVYSVSDTVNAEGNWWNSVNGACTGGDCVVGRVDTSSALASPPGGLPGLTAPLRATILAAAPAPSSGATPVTSVTPRWPAPAPRLIRALAPRIERPIPTTLPSRRIAQLERARLHRAQRASRHKSQRRPS